jgi:peptidoglycan/LPS O-acetylase OafA/YrhL
MGGLRLFLALVVLSGHVRTNVLEPAALPMSWGTTLGFNAGYALMLFYVISGFMISFALSEKYAPDRAGTLAFFRGRFVRIFSLYWPMMALCLLIVPAARVGFAAATPLDQLSDIVLLGIDWRTFVASLADAHPWTATIVSLEPSWSLGAELAFYVVAPWLLRSWRAAAAAAAVSIVTRVCLYAEFGPGSLWNYMFWPSTLVFFMLGHFARLAASRAPRLADVRIALPLLALAFALTLARPPAEWDGWRFWLIFASFAASLPGIFLSTRRNAALERLGDLSYPLYLTHPLVLTLFLTDSGSDIARPLGLAQDHVGAALFAGIAAVALIAATAVHYAIERPFGAFLKSLTASMTARLRSPAR